MIDGTGLNDTVVKCVSGEGPATILQGFTITGGTGDLSTGSHRGGGMYVSESSPTIRECVFSGNTAYRGGGLTIRLGQAFVTACDFYDNTAEFGGGLELSGDSSTVENCNFKDNIADGGGALYTLSSTATIAHDQFENNKTVITGPFIYGTGGAVLNYVSQPTFEDCVFRRNEAGDGGAIFNRESTVAVTDCLFYLNTATYGGGGGIASELSSVLVRACRFDRNRANYAGGGINDVVGDRLTVERSSFISNNGRHHGGAVNLFASYNVAVQDAVFWGNSSQSYGGGVAVLEGSNGAFDHCTLYENYAPLGSGFSFGDPTSAYDEASQFTISNSIMFHNGEEILNDDGSTVAVRYSSIRGGFEGIGNIDAYPQFLGYDFENFRLGPSSPCINAGDPNFAVVPGQTDLPGDHRVQSCRTDLGAYESSIEQVGGDFDGNRRIDLRDFAAFQSCMGAVELTSPLADVCVCSFDSTGNQSVNVEDYVSFHAVLGAGRKAPPKIDRLWPAPGEWIVDDVGLTHVQIGFTEPVIFPEQPGGLWVLNGLGVDGDTVENFTVDYDGKSALMTITFLEPLRDDVITVILDHTITGLTGTELDGEVFDPHAPALPTGDGLPGGQAVFRIHVLQGDATRNGIVDDADAGAVAASLGLCDGDSSFNAQADLNRDGCVSVDDANIVPGAIGQTLPLTDGRPPMITKIVTGELGGDEMSVSVYFDEYLSLSQAYQRSGFLVNSDGAVIDPQRTYPSPFGDSIAYVFPPDVKMCSGFMVNVGNSVADLSGELLDLSEPVPCP
jgi:hypothetical protein